MTDLPDPEPAAPPRDPAGVAPAGLLGWLPWLAAAAAALLAGVLVEINLTYRTEITILDEQNALAAVETKSLQQRLEAERILAARRIADLSVATRDLYDLSRCEIIPLHAPTPGASGPAAVVVWDAQRQRGTLVARRLPPAPGGRRYTLWLVSAGEADAIAAGEFDGDPAGGEVRFAFQSPRVVPETPGIRVTVGPAGSPPQAAGTVALSGP